MAECNYIDGLVQDCINSSANALELLQSCIKPLIYFSLIALAFNIFTYTFADQSLFKMTGKISLYIAAFKR